MSAAPELKLGVLAWNQYGDWPSLRDAGVLVDEPPAPTAPTSRLDTSLAHTSGGLTP